MTRPLATAVAPTPPSAVELPAVAKLMVWLLLIILALYLYCRFACKDTPTGSIYTPSMALPPPIPSRPRRILRPVYMETGLSSLAETLSAHECVICLEGLAVEDELSLVTLLQCGHGFHAACLAKWFGRKLSCPSCRRVPLAESSGECCSGETGVEDRAMTLSS